jgi:hypothetical protein
VKREISTEFVHPVGPATTSDQVVRVSSLVENLISRLRSDFLLRRPLGSDDLTLLQFLLNRCRYPRSEDPNRIGKRPAELLIGEPHAHWQAFLGSSENAHRNPVLHTPVSRVLVTHRHDRPIGLVDQGSRLPPPSLNGAPDRSAPIGTGCEAQIRQPYAR